MVVCEHRGWGWHSLVFLLVSFGFICYVFYQKWTSGPQYGTCSSSTTNSSPFLSFFHFLCSFPPLALLFFFVFPCTFARCFGMHLEIRFVEGSLIHQSMKSMSQKCWKKFFCYHHQMLFKSMDVYTTIIRNSPPKV